jgi:hypothetical protein
MDSKDNKFTKIADNTETSQIMRKYRSLNLIVNIMGVLGALVFIAMIIFFTYEARNNPSKGYFEYDNNIYYLLDNTWYIYKSDTSHYDTDLDDNKGWHQLNEVNTDYTSIISNLESDLKVYYKGRVYSESEQYTDFETTLFYKIWLNSDDNDYMWSDDN